MSSYFCARLSLREIGSIHECRITESSMKCCLMRRDGTLLFWPTTLRWYMFSGALGFASSNCSSIPNNSTPWDQMSLWGISSLCYRCLPRLLLQRIPPSPAALVLDTTFPFNFEIRNTNETLLRFKLQPYKNIAKPLSATNLESEVPIPSLLKEVARKMSLNR